MFLYSQMYMYNYIQVQKSFNMDVGMHHAKNRGNKEISLALLSRILAQSCVTLCLNYAGRVTHYCASILDSSAKGICIPPFIFIQMNDFCTCVPHIFHGSRINAATCMHTCTSTCVTLRSRVSLVKWCQSSSHTLGS